ncbi:Stp1/IreP family PP2C-type Ser/Thr phosphatase [Ruminococcus sp.]
MNRLFIASDTDIGKKRSENQDRVHTEFLADNAAVAVVCDGMGGASSGGVASQLAIDAVVKRIKENFRKDMKPNSIRNLMLTSVHYANTIVYGKSKEDIDKNGMGTTCVAALVVDKTVYMVSVGDSRGYLLTKDGIAQITTDHTYVEMLYRSGQITKEEAKNHHMRNVITKAVGVESDVEVDYFELEENDNFAVLLCSDGLTNYCTDNMIYETVFGNNLDEAIKQLIAFANECGGKDNITAAVIAN